MKIPDTLGHGPRRRQAGTLLIVVMVLLAIISTMIICNSEVLFTLKQDLKRVERLQLKKYAPPPARTPPQPGP